MQPITITQGETVLAQHTTMHPRSSKYEIVTPHHSMAGAWESDTTGDNEPRSLTECRRNIRAFKRGDCGPDFQTDDYYIRDVVDGSIEKG